MDTGELWLIWRSGKPSDRARYKIGVLKKKGDSYTFQYDKGEDLDSAKQAGFTSFPGFEDYDEEYISDDGLFYNIAARLPKTERDDFLDILNRYDLSASDDQFTMLCATKGCQITDNFEFVPAFDKSKIEFDVAGVDHRQTSELEEAAKDGFLTSGAKLILERERGNQYDEFAIKILLPTGKKNVFIGYVPKYYSEHLAKRLDTNTEYSAMIAKVDLGAKIRDEKISAVVRLMFAE